MEVIITRQLDQSMHFHPEMELVFVIEGTVEATVKDKTCTLSREDFLLVNSGLSHRLKCPRSSIACTVSISCRTIAEASGEESNLFFCSSLEGTEPRHQELRRILHELVYTKIKKKRSTSCLKRSVLYKLLDCLLEYFRIPSQEKGAAQSDDVKLMRVYEYINRNYQESISLTALADQLYMSKSTLSRFFKKETGVYFADYLNQVRLKHAMEDLSYTDKNVTKIAMDSGFSSPSAFNKLFRESYGVTPTEYRLENGLRERQEDRSDKDLEEELCEKLSLEEEEDKASLALEVSLSSAVPWDKKWTKVMNAGSAYGLTTVNLQKHVLYLRDTLGFRYVRLWSIFSKNLTITDGKTRGRYNYDRLDTALDFVVENGLIPFLDFGRRPNTAVYSPRVPVYDTDEYIPFASRQLWEDLLRDLMLHLANRYGESETGKWVFEFSYDFVNAPQRDYYEDFNYTEAFAFAYRTIKRAAPGAEVGGPMAEMDISYSFVTSFLSGCRKEGITPDFVSFMLFPYHTDMISSERATSPETEKELVRMMRKLVDESGFDTKLYITEWNNTLSNRNFLNDSCYRAAYTLRKISELMDYTDLIALWVASDWISSYFDTVSLANGGSGLVTKDGIAKPVYYALRFLYASGSKLINKGPDYFVTESSRDSWHIILFNYKWFGPNYFIQKEGIRRPEQLFEIFSDTRPLEAELTLTDLPDGEYVVKRRVVNENEGSLLGEWRKLQYDEELSAADLKYLRESCIPQLSMEHVRATDRKLWLKTVLLPHEIALIHVYRHKEKLF